MDVVIVVVDVVTVHVVDLCVVCTSVVVSASAKGPSAVNSYMTSFMYNDVIYEGW